MKIFSFLLLIILLCSCSAQKRLNRIIHKNPHLVNSDTTTYLDTVKLYTNEFKVDTFTTINSMRKDTFIVHEENVIVKTFFRHDTIVQIVEKQKDSLITVVEKQTIINSVTAQPVYTWKKILYLILALVALIVLFRIIWPLIKRFIPFIK